MSVPIDENEDIVRHLSLRYPGCAWGLIVIRPPSEANADTTFLALSHGFLGQEAFLNGMVIALGEIAGQNPETFNVKRRWDA